MGILWWRGNKKALSSPGAKTPMQKSNPTHNMDLPEQPGIPGMNGAVEVRRPGLSLDNVTIFEFGSVATSTDKVTLAGYCSLSDDLEPCRWEILPANGDNAPQFRVVF